MDILVGVIVGLIVLMFLVTVHEFGHFLAARKNGVNVLEFGIGFPPRAIAWVKDKKTGKWRRLKRAEWKKDKVSKVVYSESDHKLAQDGMIFSLNWLPIGGFCQMDGESAEDDKKGTFGNARFLAKTKILFAGVAMNWLVAIVIFTILAWVGMPSLPGIADNQFTVPIDTRVEYSPIEVVEIKEDSPAEKAGIMVGDLILSIDEKQFSVPSEITEYNKEHAGEEVNVKVFRKGEEGCNCDAEQMLSVTLNEEGSEYLLGVSMTSSVSYYSTWSAPIVGIGLTTQLTWETFKGVGTMLGNLFSGIARQFSFDASVRESGQEAISEVGNSVTGPVGIIGIIFPNATSNGPKTIAYLTALISVSLACMNVLPIPALDGGRWLLIAIYKLRKKKLTKETEEKIVSRAFLVLLALIFIVTILDIIRMPK